MDHAQFGHANENKKCFLAIEKSMLKTEDNTSSIVQETLEFKMTKPKENHNFHQHKNVPEKWFIGVANLQFQKTAEIISEKNSTCTLYSLLLLTEDCRFWKHPKTISAGLHATK